MSINVRFVKTAISLALAMAITGCVSNPPAEAQAVPEKIAAPAIKQSEPKVNVDAVVAAEAVKQDPVRPTVPKPESVISAPASTESPDGIRSTPVAAPVAGQPISESDLQQKIQYAGVLFMSKASKRISASDNAEAKGLLEQSKQKMNEAKAGLSAGKLADAQLSIDESMRLFNTASRMVPSEEMQSEQKKRYEALLKEVADARASHKQNYDRMVAKKGASAGVKYDAKEVDRLLAEAKTAAAKSDFVKAVDSSTKASNLVNNAITQMLAGQEIRYELNIGTPEGEYNYEYDRYLGYDELVPVAIETRLPNEGQMMLINKNVETAKKMAAESQKKAKEGDYPTAIRMALDAQEKVRAALRIMGVNQ